MSTISGDDMITGNLYIPQFALRVSESYGRLRFAFLSLCVVLLSAHVASAQLDRGGIVGIVTDESQAVLPGATVAITNKETGQVTTMITDTAGRYGAALLRIG